MNKIISGRTILLNTVTNCTFVATDMDEQAQTGTRECDKHIEWCGELSFKYIRMEETPRWEYTGEGLPGINKGDILEGNLTTWSIACGNGERKIEKVLYVEGVGFNGEQVPVNLRNLKQITP